MHDYDNDSLCCTFCGESEHAQMLSDPSIELSTHAHTHRLPADWAGWNAVRAVADRRFPLVDSSSAAFQHHEKNCWCCRGAAAANSSLLRPAAGAGTAAGTVLERCAGLCAAVLEAGRDRGPTRPGGADAAAQCRGSGSGGAATEPERGTSAARWIRAAECDHDALLRACGA